jgi:GT2 family glycosyltransferase
MEGIDVSVVIVHWDGYPLLRDCMRSIYKRTTGVRFEIVVVDNGSTDGSTDAAKRDFPDAIVVRAGKNLGYGHGNNLGSRRSSGKYLLFLNDDTVLLNNAVKGFFEFAEGHPELRIGAIGPLLRDGKGDAANSFGDFPHPFSQVPIILENLGITHRERKAIEASRRSSRKWFPSDFVSGAALFVPRKVFEEMGGFDEDFFLYFEETELQYRMAASSLRRYVLDGPLIIHLGGGGCARSNRIRIETYRGMFLYYRKTHGGGKLLLFRLFAPLFVVMHLFHPSFTLRENLEFVRVCRSELRKLDTKSVYADR